jgi:hypothetical protein
MADDKIVTKKTPVKAASTPATAAAKATPPRKTAMPAASVAPAAPKAPAPAPAKPGAKPAAASAAKPAATPSATTPKAKEAPTPKAKPQLDAQTRLAMIQESAYYKAEARNFAPGFEALDWADAEREIDALLGK